LKQEEEHALAMLQRTKELVVPVPALSDKTEEPKNVWKGLVGIMNDPRVFLGVAVGEQAIANFIDMAQPDAIDHLQAAVHCLQEAGAIDAFMTVGNVALGIESFGDIVVEPLFENGIDGVFSVSGMEESLNHSFHHVGDASSHVGEAFHGYEAAGFHFPWMTMLLSLARESALICEEKTTIKRALAHVAIDTTGTAVGGFGGAKAGALLGTAIAPGAGSIVGGLLGAVVGALGGRKIATTIKFMPLTKSMEAFGKYHQAMEIALRDSALQAEEHVHFLAEGEQRWFQNVQQPVPLPSRLLQRDSKLENMAYELRDALCWQYEESCLEIEQVSMFVRSKAPRDHLVHRLFGLSIEPEIEQEIIEAEREATSGILKHLESLKNVGMEYDALSLLRVVASSPHLSDNRIEALTIGVADEAVQLIQHTHQELRDWQHQVAHNYQQCLAKISEALTLETNRHRSVFEAHFQKLECTKLEIQQHRAALGLDET
jgi:hypothetical protein